MIREKTPFVFLLLSAFLMLTLMVIQHLTRPFDLSITQLLQAHTSLELDYAMSAFTFLGSVEFSCFAVLMICWYLYRKYDWSGAFLYLFFFVALSAVEFIWKYYVAYTAPGPEFDRSLFQWGFVTVTTPYAFPSGNTFRGCFLLGIWYQRLCQRDQPNPWSVGFQRVVLALIAFGIGYSRIYLGAHWLSDVIGGYLLAAIGLSLSIQPLERELRPA
jgi:membrane-associated phospholipid phosphatase